MSPKKKKHAEEENAERWLLTYADMITLLVAFFMMMYSMSVLNLEKFKEAAIGIRSGFNGPAAGKKQSGDSMIEKGVSQRPVPDMKVMVVAPNKPKAVMKKRERVKKPPAKGLRPTAVQLRQERVDKLTKQINKSLIGVTQGEAAKVVEEETGVAIELIGDLIFFPKGTAHLSKEAKNILLAVTSVLSVLTNEISVEGYTGSFENNENSQFSNSWELSTARAMAVVKYFMSSNKIKPSRISITGFGQYRPLKGSKQSPQGIDDSNDRVRIFIYQE